jgi:hypothetical protein
MAGSWPRSRTRYIPSHGFCGRTIYFGYRMMIYNFSHGTTFLLWLALALLFPFATIAALDQ